MSSRGYAAATAIVETGKSLDGQNLTGKEMADK